jgi:type IV pilus assembly protein PilE
MKDLRKERLNEQVVIGCRESQRNAMASGLGRVRASSAAGFTLIELMVVMTVVAILAAIAIPNYSDYIKRGHRADMQAFMAAVAGQQKAHFLDKRSFSTTLSGLGSMSVPASLAPRYDFTLAADNAATPPSFTLTAAPKGAQTGEQCGTLTLQSNGARLPAGCW